RAVPSTGDSTWQIFRNAPVRQPLREGLPLLVKHLKEMHGGVSRLYCIVHFQEWLYQRVHVEGQCRQNEYRSHCHHLKTIAVLDFLRQMKTNGICFAGMFFLKNVGLVHKKCPNLDQVSDDLPSPFPLSGSDHIPSE